MKSSRLARILWKIDKIRKFEMQIELYGMNCSEQRLIITTYVAPSLPPLPFYFSFLFVAYITNDFRLTLQSLNLRLGYGKRSSSILEDPY